MKKNVEIALSALRSEIDSARSATNSKEAEFAAISQILTRFQALSERLEDARRSHSGFISHLDAYCSVSVENWFGHEFQKRLHAMNSLGETFSNMMGEVAAQEAARRNREKLIASHAAVTVREAESVLEAFVKEHADVLRKYGAVS
jgi:hypothetical protein